VTQGNAHQDMWDNGNSSLGKYKSKGTDSYTYNMPLCELHGLAAVRFGLQRGR